MKKIFLFIVLLNMVYVVFSQTESNFNQASIYQYSGTLAGTEQLKIRTYIWGQVKNPGLYIVPDNTDILTLISSAGGPTEHAKLSTIKIIRTAGGKEEVFNVDLRKYLETGNAKLVTILKPGDTIIVSGSTYYAFTKAVNWLSQIASVLSTYLIITNLNN